MYKNILGEESLMESKIQTYIEPFYAEKKIEYLYLYIQGEKLTQAYTHYVDT